MKCQHADPDENHGPADPRSQCGACLECAKAAHTDYDDCPHDDEHCPWQWKPLVSSEVLAS